MANKLYYGNKEISGGSSGGGSFVATRELDLENRVDISASLNANGSTWTATNDGNIIAYQDGTSGSSNLEISVNNSRVARCYGQGSAFSIFPVVKGDIVKVSITSISASQIHISLVPYKTTEPAKVLANSLVDAVENRVNTYSTEEQKIGTWINGKPIYRKVVECGALPNAGFKYIKHNISNIDCIRSVTGVANKPSDNLWISLPWVSVHDADSMVQCYVNNENIVFYTQSDRSNVTESWVTIEYTKTTD